MYKVFFKDRTLFLTDSLDIDLCSDFNAIHKYTSHHELKAFIESFEQKTKLTRAYLYGRPVHQLLTELKKCFRFLRAAGGLVINNEGQLLIIHRLGVYDLPKGKAEKGETIEQTAIREVTEECGIRPLLIEKKLCSSFHTYIQNEIHYLKETVWFMMNYQGNWDLKPQAEENIIDAKWMDPHDLRPVKQNTYPSIIEVLTQGGY